VLADPASREAVDRPHMLLEPAAHHDGSRSVAIGRRFGFRHHDRCCPARATLFKRIFAPFK
jgi:hypothetical protein